MPTTTTLTELQSVVVLGNWLVKKQKKKKKKKAKERTGGDRIVERAACSRIHPNERSRRN